MKPRLSFDDKKMNERKTNTMEDTEHISSKNKLSNQIQFPPGK